MPSSVLLSNFPDFYRSRERSAHLYVPGENLLANPVMYCGKPDNASVLLVHRAYVWFNQHWIVGLFC